MVNCLGSFVERFFNKTSVEHEIKNAQTHLAQVLKNNSSQDEETLVELRDLMLKTLENCTQENALRTVSKKVSDLLANLIQQNGGYIGGSMLYNYGYNDSQSNAQDIDVFFTDEKKYNKFIANLNKIAEGKPTFEAEMYKGKIRGWRLTSNDTFDGSQPFIGRYSIDVHLVESILQPCELLVFPKVQEYLRPKFAYHQIGKQVKYVSHYKKTVENGEIIEVPVYDTGEIAYFENGVPVLYGGKELPKDRVMKE